MSVKQTQLWLTVSGAKADLMQIQTSLKLLMFDVKTRII